MARRERWPPRDDEEVLTPSSAEVEVEGKKPRTDIESVDEAAMGIDMVYVLSLSFRATAPQEEVDEHTSNEEGPSVAELQLMEHKVEAEVVVFEKPSAFQTRFIRPLYIQALIEGRPVGCVMVDGGAMVNVMTTTFLKRIGKREKELKTTRQ